MNYTEYIDEINNKISEYKICIFGCGYMGQECQKYLRKMNFEPDIFLDNDKNKKGSIINGTHVILPLFIKKCIVIIAVSHYYEEIKTQLMTLGYSKNDIYRFEDIYVLFFESNIQNKITEEKRLQEYPDTIQLPITHLCNFNCVMCGMRKQIMKKDFTPNELQLILRDKLFSNVKNVGINGGEPFMRRDLLECIDVILGELPKLKSINIISNGFFTESILKKLEIIKEKCDRLDIKLNLAISIDGVGKIQDFQRGRKNAYDNAVLTCTKILEQKERYVNHLEIICTITKYNINNINEMILLSEDLDIDVSYNIATENVRIENQDAVNDFSVLSDPLSRMLTMEFFYNEYRRTKKEKYYSLFLYLRDGVRYADCPCKHNQWITVLPDSSIGFCATRSRKLGSGIEKSPYELVKDNLSYLKEIKEEFCDKCSHYMYGLNADGLKELLKEQLRNRDLEW